MKHLEKKIKRFLTVAILLTVSNINPIFAQNDAKLVYYGSDSIGHNFDPMDSVEVSLLTCSPHEEIYSLYGHAAIRWHSGDQDLVFNCENSLFEKTGEDHIGSGIGVENLKRRLELIYPGAYSYEQHEQDGVYSVRITLKNLLG